MLQVSRLKERKKARRNEREQGTEEETVQASTVLRENVLKLIHGGHMSKAVRRVVSHGIADHSDQRGAAQLQSKFPPKKEIFPGQSPLFSQ